jgi:hypothetical protein
MAEAMRLKDMKLKGAERRFARAYLWWRAGGTNSKPTHYARLYGGITPERREQITKVIELGLAARDA